MTGNVKIRLTGRIDSNNASQVENDIRSQLEGMSRASVVLEYISSAGLRVILRLKKVDPDITITGVCSDVYEILDMTGFTEIMTVEKAYRVVSIEGCEEIGRGANGTIYRIDQDNVVKVYNNADALAEIRHEREVAKLALILGIPTAISYDVVKVGDSYGSVFELLNARSFSKILSTEPDKMDWCVQEYVGMLKKIHGTIVPAGKLPDMKETVRGWAEFMRDYLPAESADKLVSLVDAVPHDDHMIHGDYHTKNLELQNDEVLLIDMDTLSVGHPIFELASIFNAFVGFSELNHEVIRKFQGFDYDTAQIFWHKFLASYLETDDREEMQAVEDKARIIGYTRLIRRSIRRGGLEDENERSEIAFWKDRLLELLGRVDTLIFERARAEDAPENELHVAAKEESLPEVQDFIEQRLMAADCPMKTVMQITLAAEEIFVNIAKHAYAPGTGDAYVRVEVRDDPKEAYITFIDSGIAYDPMKKADPDVTLSAEDRQIGGLGIYMVKQLIDNIHYEYIEGENRLTLIKAF